MIKKGFSLLELMIAVFITSIVIVAAYSMVSSSNTGFQDQNDQKVLEENLRNAELIIQRDLSRIGYHVPLDSTVAAAFLDYNVSDPTNTPIFGFSGGKIVAFGRHAALENGLITPFSFVSDLTDFQTGFKVSNQESTTLTLDSSGLKNGRTALDIHRAAVAGTDFDDNTLPKTAIVNPSILFDKSFKHAKAIFAFSPQNQGAMMKVDSVAQSGTTFTVTLNQLPAPGLSFDPGTPLLGLGVYPIVGVTYRAIKNNDDEKCNGLNTYRIERCYNSDILQLTGSVEGCQLLLDNVTKMQLMPIPRTNHNSAMDEYRNYLDGTEITAKVHRQNLNIGNLAGFVFRIAACSSRPRENGSFLSFEIQGTSKMTTENHLDPSTGANIDLSATP